MPELRNNLLNVRVKKDSPLERYIRESPCSTATMAVHELADAYEKASGKKKPAR